MLKTLIGATLGTIVAFSGLVPAQAQWMIESGRTHNLEINAWGGAKEGTVLRLNNTCSTNNPDCTWNMLDNGMIVSNRDRNLAINAWGGAKVGAELHLTKTCKSNNPDCTWSILDNNMIVSNRDRNLAINAWGGGRQGTVLRLNNTCDPNNILADNPDCTWWWIGGLGEYHRDMDPVGGVAGVPKAPAGLLAQFHQKRGELPGILALPTERIGIAETPAFEIHGVNFPTAKPQIPVVPIDAFEDLVFEKGQGSVIKLQRVKMP
jgi:hypothetical protein